MKDYWEKLDELTVAQLEEMLLHDDISYESFRNQVIKRTFGPAIMLLEKRSRELSEC